MPSPSQRAVKREKSDEQSSSTATPLTIPSTTPSTTPSTSARSTVSLSREDVKEAVRNNKVLFDAYGNKGVLQSVSITDLVNTTRRYKSMPDTIKKGGTFNWTIIATSEIARPWWMTAKRYTLPTTVNSTTSLRSMTPNGFAFRYTKTEEDPDDYPEEDDMIEELYMTLYAAHMGVGPSVYAAAIQRGDHPHLYMLLSGGYSTNTLERSPVAPELLYESCKRAADAGLLLLDIKPPNTITIGTTEEEDIRVQMIDFGADFTFQIFDANYTDGDGKATCLLFLNLCLLISYMKCNEHFLSTTITSLFSMMERLDTSSSSLCDIVNSIYIPERWRVCHGKGTWANYITARDCERFESVYVPPKFDSSGVTTEDDYKKLVVKYVFMLCYYVVRVGCVYPAWVFNDDQTMMQQLKAWLS